jgi:hypothetical protein
VQSCSCSRACPLCRPILSLQLAPAVSQAYQEILKRKRESAATDELLQKHFSDPTQQANALKAKSILSNISTLLTQVKEAADECTKLAQLNIQWLKALDRAKDMKYPLGVQEILRLVSLSSSSATGARTVTSKGKKKTKVVVTMFDCSATHALDPMERVCEQMQVLASTGMALPGCGLRYGESN